MPKTKSAIEKTIATKKLRGNLATAKKGEQNSRWRGGREAAIARARASGALNASVRRYREKNPDKVREWRHSRRAKQFSQSGRLPRGTITKLVKLQKGKCVYCLVPFGDKYHVDHIQPIALGGKHEPHNLQLLCPPCNWKKSAKDPIVWAQKIGKLL